MTPEFSTTDRELLQQTTNWSGPKQLNELDDELLCELSRTRGVDFATALLYQAIASSDDHGPLMRCMNELLQHPPMNHEALDAALVIAPGAFYREHPHTGAGGESLCRIAAELGCRTHVIPTQSIGTAAANGSIIRDWLSDSDEENIILCSLSKGGADVKMALAQPDAFRNVVAWINVGGITSGSAMATWILGRPLLSTIYHTLFWWRGQDLHFVRDIARRPGSPLDFKVSAPSHVKVIHLLGFPLVHHLRTRPTSRWHRRLARYGPNDGATILADSCDVPGLILPVWGDDHYLDMRHSPERLLAALLHYLGNELNLFVRSARTIPLAASSANS